MKKTRFQSILWRVALGAPLSLAAILILGPIGIMFIVSFWQKTGLTMVPDFTLKSYEVFFGGVRLGIFLRSIVVALVSTIIMLLIAYPLAYIITRKVRSSMTGIVLFLFSVPFLVNFIIRTFSWSDILSRSGFINSTLMTFGLIDAPLDWLLFSTFSVYLGLITAYMPFMIFPIWLSLSGMDQKYEQASWMLGERPLRTFLRITLPLSLPGVFAAAIFGFVGAFGEFAVSTILGGTGYQLLGNSIVSSLDVVNYPLAAAMSSISIAVMLVLLGAWFYFFNLRLFLGKIMGRL